MSGKKAARTIKHRRLSYKELDYTVKFRPSRIKNSDAIDPCCEIIGQNRAIEAIKMGLDIKSRGYNIFVTGLPGTGRTTTIKHLLEQLGHDSPQLQDVCYVNNFKDPDSPRLLTFPAGEGKRFKKDMTYLIDSLRKVVPKIFMSEDYKDRNSRIVREFEGRQKKQVSNFEDQLTQAGFVMVQIQSGSGSRNEVQPLIDEEPISLDKLERLLKEGKFSEARLDDLRRKWDGLRREFDITTIETKKLASKMEDAIEKLNHSMVAPLVIDKVNLLKKRYPGDAIRVFLDEVEETLSTDLDRYRESQPRRGEDEAPPYRKRGAFEEFSVNLLLDNSDTTSVPIVIEKSPTYKNLFGSLERVVDRFGYWRTDFTRIHSGSLLKATGGFLVANAVDLLSEPGVWVQLKRVLRNGEMEIAGFDPFYMMAGSGIKPEPIPLDVKVLLVGKADIYNLLWHYDEDFKKNFKVKAEFDTVMSLNDSNMLEYFRFIRRLVDQENLPTFELSGMQAIVEYGRRLAGERKRLSVRFTAIADMIREAAYCTRSRRAKSVTRKDVYRAISQKRTRLNLMEDKIQEMYDQGVLMVSISGTAVGQINALSVYNLGEYSFGRPTRITANTSLGKAGVINIERDADLSGKIHTKGVAVLSGYLRESFAQDKPLVMSASITFEQSYGGVDGDSASAAEIYAILSSLTGIPILQSIAITGSVNQKGMIQPIGGINEKVEGFFDTCKSKGLKGTQGVIFPHQNARDLLLRPDVIDAVRAGKFHLYPIKTVADGIEILMQKLAGRRLAKGGFTAGSVMAMADERLKEMAIAIERFGRDAQSSSNNKQLRRKTNGKRAAKDR